MPIVKIALYTLFMVVIGAGIAFLFGQRSHLQLVRCALLCVLYCWGISLATRMFDDHLYQFLIFTLIVLAANAIIDGPIRFVGRRNEREK